MLVLISSHRLQTVLPLPLPESGQLFQRQPHPFLRRIPHPVCHPDHALLPGCHRSQRSAPCWRSPQRPDWDSDWDSNRDLLRFPFSKPVASLVPFQFHETEDFRSLYSVSHATVQQATEPDPAPTGSQRLGHFALQLTSHPQLLRYQSLKLSFPSLHPSFLPPVTVTRYRQTASLVRDAICALGSRQRHETELFSRARGKQTPEASTTKVG